MIFTRRTYRVAVRQSIDKEQDLQAEFKEQDTAQSAIKWFTQINHTRRLQQRKRRERK